MNRSRRSKRTKLSFRTSVQLTFYIDRAPTGQHHHVGRRAGWSWGFHSNSDSGAAGRWSVGGGACGACEWVTDYNCREEMKPLFSKHHIDHRLIDAVAPSLFPVSAGTGRDAFWLAVALATALAVTVKAVWGTSRGIKGTSLRPSMLHSDELFGPDMLKWNQICLKWQFLLKRMEAASVDALTDTRWCWGVHRWQLCGPQRGGALWRYWKQKTGIRRPLLVKIFKTHQTLELWKKYTQVFWWGLSADPSCPLSGLLGLLRH